MKHLTKFESFGSNINESMSGIAFLTTSIVGSLLGIGLGELVLGEIGRTYDDLKYKLKMAGLDREAKRWVKQNLIDDKVFYENFKSLKQKLQNKDLSPEKINHLNQKIQNSLYQKLIPLRSENIELYHIIKKHVDKL